MKQRRTTDSARYSRGASCGRALLKKLWIVVAAGLIFALGTGLWIRQSDTPSHRAVMTYAVVYPRTEGETGGIDSSQAAAVIASLLQTDMVKEQLPAFDGRIRVLQAGESNLLTVYAEAWDPQQALAALQTLAEVFPPMTEYLSQTLQLRIVQNPVLSSEPDHSADSASAVLLAGILGMAVAALVLVWSMKKTQQQKAHSDDPQQEPETPQQIDVYAVGRRFLRIWKRGWALALALTVLGAALGWLWSAGRFTPVYTASARFTLHSGNSGAGTGFYEDPAAQQLAKTFPDVLQMPWMHALLKEHLGVEKLDADITAQALAQTNLIQLTVQSTDAQEACRILQAVLDCYPQVAQHMTDAPRILVRQQPEVPEMPDSVFSPVKASLEGGLAGLVVAVVILLLFAGVRQKATVCEKTAMDS